MKFKHNFFLKLRGLKIIFRIELKQTIFAFSLSQDLTSDGFDLYIYIYI